MFLTIQQVDRYGTFFCFPVDGAMTQVLFPLTHKHPLGGGKCLLPTGVLGVSLFDWLTSVWWGNVRVGENQFCEFPVTASWLLIATGPAVLMEASPLPLSGSAGMGRVRKVTSRLQLCLLVSNVWHRCAV